MPPSSFVVAYCKESTIDHVLTSIPSMIAEEYDAEVVISDNASTDHTFVSASSIQLPFHLMALSNASNRDIDVLHLDSSELARLRTQRQAIKIVENSRLAGWLGSAHEGRVNESWALVAKTQIKEGKALTRQPRAINSTTFWEGVADE